MNKQCFFGLILCFSATAGTLGCAGPQAPVTPAASTTTCIRGTVLYTHPVSAAMVPFTSAAVTAWRHGTNQGLAEVRSDNKGNYCIDIPGGSGIMDVRVWGTDVVEGKTYVCEGSASNVSTGSIAGTCGSGDCLEVNIRAQCRERSDRRRGF